MLPNAITITVDGTDATDDVLKALRPKTNGTYNVYQFDFYGLDGSDKLFASNGPRNWAQYSLNHPTAQIEVVNNLYGGAGNDVLYASAGQRLAPSVAANYSIKNVLSGGDGNDTYVLNSHDVKIIESDNPGAGIDTIVLKSGAMPATDSYFFMSDFANVENLRIQGGFLYDKVYIIGNDADNTIWDNASDGDISGGLGDDTLYGNGGNDQLQGGAGSDVLYGGDGDDFVLGGDDDDRVMGGIGNDVLYGGLGNDVLRGGVGDDALYGEDGNDVLNGGAGADYMLGGDGDDIYFVDDIGDFVYENQDSGFDTIISSVMTLRATNFLQFEALELRGTGNFDLYGDDDGMTLTGNSGNNRIYGGAGADIISGGSGDDTIVGGVGADVLSGGDGADVFVFNAKSFEGYLQDLVDSSMSILDFKTGEDKIDLSSGSWIQSGNNSYHDYVNDVHLSIYSSGFTMFLSGGDRSMSFNLSDPISVSDFLLFD